MKVANPKSGDLLEINHRKVEYSYWPARKGIRKFQMQARVFATNPFNIIETAITEAKITVPQRKEALAYFAQAKDFYNASQLGNVENAKPLLVYYCFHNLVKSLLISKKKFSTIADSHHGLNLNFDSLGNKPTTSKMTAHKTTNKNRPNIFEELNKLFKHGEFSTNRLEVSVSELFPQVLIGHRLWCVAANKKERFINIPEVSFVHDKSKKQIWGRMTLPKSEYIRLKYSQNDLLNLTKLNSEWKIVLCKNGYLNTSISQIDQDLISLEHKTPFTAARPSDKVNLLAASISSHLWSSVSITKPFRKHYIYLSNDENVWPQFCSIYAIYFYLGSLARYRPQKLKQFSTGRYGAFISEFIENQTDQWLYLIASEFNKQEVARAAIV